MTTGTSQVQTVSEFQRALAREINKSSLENNTNTPDFILAQYLVDCLSAFERAHQATSDWHVEGILLSESKNKNPNWRQTNDNPEKY